MTIKAVGILSPGEMGSGVGTVLHQHGVRVLTCLAGRGAGSRERAFLAGFEEVANLDELVAQSDVLLSIGSAADTSRMVQVLLIAVATHRVGNRPDRVEPREVKRRRKTAKLMMKARAERRAELLAGIGV